MAIITQPLLPGSYVWGKGKALVFTRLVKTDIVRQGITGWTKTVQQTRIPCDPMTQAQLGVRALISFISRQWYLLDAGTKLNWKLSTPEAYKRATAYYLWFQLTRWLTFKTPSQTHEAPEESTPIAISDHQYHGGKRFASLSLTPADDTSLYGILILRSKIEILTPSYLQTIAMIPKNTATPLLYTDSPLNAGTYHYRAAAFNTDGVLGPVLADDTVSVS